MTTQDQGPGIFRSLISALILLLFSAGAVWVTVSTKILWPAGSATPDVASLLPAGLGATATLIALVTLGPHNFGRLVHVPGVLSVLGLVGLATLRYLQIGAIVSSLPDGLHAPPWHVARDLVADALQHQQVMALGSLWVGLGLAATALALVDQAVQRTGPRGRWVIAAWTALGLGCAAVVLAIPVLRSAYTWQMIVVVGLDGIAQLPYWLGYYLQHFATTDTLRSLPTWIPLATLLALFPLLGGRLLPTPHRDDLDGERGLAAAALIGAALCLGLSAQYAAAWQALTWCQYAAFSEGLAAWGSTAYYDYHAFSSAGAAATLVAGIVAAPLFLAPRGPMGARLVGPCVLIACTALLAAAQVNAVHRVSRALPTDDEKGYTLWDATAELTTLQPLPYTWDDFSGWVLQLAHSSWVAEDSDRRVPELAVNGDVPEASLLAVSRDRVTLARATSNFGRRWDQDLAVIDGGHLADHHQEAIPALKRALDGITSDHWDEDPDTDPVLNVAVDRSLPMSTVTVIRNTAWEAGVDAPAFLVARSGAPYHPNYGAVWLYTPPREGLVQGTPLWVLTVEPDGVRITGPSGTEHRADSARELLPVVTGSAGRNAVLLVVHDDDTLFGDYLAAVVPLSSVELFPVVFHSWVSTQQQAQRLEGVRAIEVAASQVESDRDWRTEVAFRTVGDVVFGPVPTDWWVEDGDGYRRMRQPPLP